MVPRKYKHKWVENSNFPVHALIIVGELIKRGSSADGGLMVLDVLYAG